MSQPRTERLKPFLDSVPPGALVETAWLKRQGIDRKSIHNYVQRGWLETVTRGVYRRLFLSDASEDVRTGWFVPVLSIQCLLAYDMHLGGLSALREHGHVHYLPAGGKEDIYLYGEIPTWLSRIETNAHFITRTRKLFGDDLLGIENVDHQKGSNSNAGKRNVAPTPGNWRLKISTPERAILEALDELPNKESFHNIDMIFQGLVNIRPKQMIRLLKHCRSIKVKRLFFVFADRHNHAWLKHIDKSAVDLGSGPRALVKDGKLHHLYRIYVPKEFALSGGQEGSDNV